MLRTSHAGAEEEDVEACRGAPSVRRTLSAIGSRHRPDSRSVCIRTRGRASDLEIQSSLFRETHSTALQIKPCLLPTSLLVAQALLPTLSPPPPAANGPHSQWRTRRGDRSALQAKAVPRAQARNPPPQAADRHPSPPAARRAHHVPVHLPLHQPGKCCLVPRCSRAEPVSQLVSELDITGGDEKKVGYYAGMIVSTRPSRPPHRVH